MKIYIDKIHDTIEQKRNDLRAEYYKNNDLKVKETLDEYEIAYFESCIKIEEIINDKLLNNDLNE